MKQRRKYVGLIVMPVLMEPAGMLAASEVTPSHSRVESVGQELGPVYDLTSPNGIDEANGKTFSHEWQATYTD